MTYQLGIDLGTTYTAAGVRRAADAGRRGAEVVPLGNRAAMVPSVLFLGADGSVLVGEAAERRALTDPERVVREFKRRVGDDTPLLVAGEPHHAHELAARMVRWVVDRVTEREGASPELVALSHPAAWGPHRRSRLAEAVTAAGVDNAVFLTEPQAAAVSYAHAERVEPGSVIAVYDLGGGTFDAAVLRKTDVHTFELLGTPDGIERLGGVDFDEIVFDQLRAQLADAFDHLDPTDPVALNAVARLRRECTEAKEALSADTEVTIPVLLPEVRTQARLARVDFEAMIRPALEETVAALSRTVRSAGVCPADLTAVLLVGGSSRIPLVAQLVSAALGRPIAVDADPNTAVALGAALAAGGDRPAPAVTVPPWAQRPVPSVPEPLAQVPLARSAMDEVPPDRPAVDEVPLPVPAPPRRRVLPKLVLGVGGLAVVAAAAMAFSFHRKSDSSAEEAKPGQPVGSAPATTDEPGYLSGRPGTGRAGVDGSSRPSESAGESSSAESAHPEDGQVVPVNHPGVAGDGQTPQERSGERSSRVPPPPSPPSSNKEAKPPLPAAPVDTSIISTPAPPPPPTAPSLPTNPSG
ncbi:hypothetical protein GCM10012275_01620 [Longimycelium tulufanense]|uniref:Hsp70 protein n=1 Tax=Longimycelium tulufanense TaxID=907463 RepID=A0A8J3FSC0_9PSEU|nr:Hsp70 family protein [Longimycelium tulufanense]GGM33891.1 hypothetical protein GCM10012275_01620 [Longimycelium tulufanense]